MKPRHPALEELLALQAGRLDAAAIETLRSHVQVCGPCSMALEDLARAASAVSAMGRADRLEAGSTMLWSAVQARIRRPTLAQRLPLRLATTWRLVAALAHPPVVTSFAAVLAGLVLGTWMALVAQPKSNEAQAGETYTASSLVEDSEAGLAGDYLRIDSGTENGASEKPSTDAQHDSALNSRSNVPQVEQVALLETGASP